MGDDTKNQIIQLQDRIADLQRVHQQRVEQLQADLVQSQGDTHRVNQLVNQYQHDDAKLHNVIV